MKKLLLTLALIGSVILSGCGTTFEQRKQVYAAIYRKAASIVHTYGPVAAKVYLNKKVKDDELDQHTADYIYDSLTNPK